MLRNSVSWYASNGCRTAHREQREAPGQPHGKQPVGSCLADPSSGPYINENFRRRRLPDESEEARVVRKLPPDTLPVDLSYQPEVWENMKFHDHPPDNEGVCLGPIYASTKVRVVHERG